MQESSETDTDIYVPYDDNSDNDDGERDFTLVNKCELMLEVPMMEETEVADQKLRETVTEKQNSETEDDISCNIKIELGIKEEISAQKRVNKCIIPSCSTSTSIIILD